MKWKTSDVQYEIHGLVSVYAISEIVFVHDLQSMDRKSWPPFTPSCLVGITHTSASASTSCLGMKHKVELVFSPWGKRESLPRRHRVWSGAARILLAK